MTAIILTYSLIIFVIFPSPYRLFCFLGMLFSSGGDILLAKWEPIMTAFLKKHSFEAGTMSFIIAHCLYSAAFIIRQRMSGTMFFNYGTVLGTFIFIILVTFLFWLNKTNSSGSNIQLLILCVVYLAFICFDCTSVLSCSAASGGWLWLSGIGAISFLISDVFIAVDFVGGRHINNKDQLIWWFYPIGQILLLTGI
ncbi:MAG: lysoplasmalogenase family protein [Oscillospiraceae bacterium]|nr:lysoplasmalogenase family protein [Oscillospiraceae bacterium]